MTTPQGNPAETENPTLWDEVEAAVQYRGDVTIQRREPLTPVTGFVFDFHRGNDLASSSLRMFLPDQSEKQAIALGDVVAIELSGKDAAAGKSFESWVKKYLRQKYADAVPDS